MIILSFHCGQCGAIWDVQEKDLDGNFPNCSRGCDEGTSFLNDYLIKEDWIPVKKETPTKPDYYDAYDGLDVFCSWYSTDLGWETTEERARNVTHWRPRPEPPKGEV